MSVEITAKVQPSSHAGPDLAHWEYEDRPGWTLCGQPPEAPSNLNGPDCVVCRSIAEDGVARGRFITRERL